MMLAAPVSGKSRKEVLKTSLEISSILYRNSATMVILMWHMRVVAINTQQN